ncbi:unnamed protein product, partial [Menidia menidia]
MVVDLRKIPTDSTINTGCGEPEHPKRYATVRPRTGTTVIEWMTTSSLESRVKEDCVTQARITIRNYKIKACGGNLSGGGTGLGMQDKGCDVYVNR